MQSIADYDELIPEWRAQYYNNQGFQAIIRYYGEIAGMIGFHGINWETKVQVSAIGLDMIFKEKVL